MDLYDLIWLFQANPDIDLPELIEIGSRLDKGLTAEAALTSLVGTELSVSACGFSRTRTARQVLPEITTLKSNLEVSLEKLTRSRPVPPIGKLVRALRK